ncbi:MAG: hypothetical protein MI755_08245 [Sphingomonadales bacterium]|nr:hypothetical protein [Sphingomonadales bacterium]
MKRIFLTLILFFWGMPAAVAQNTITVQGDLAVNGSITGIGQLPVGAVIDWWRTPGSSTQIPEGFQICDGSRVADPDSPLNGQTLPDLQHRFAYGVTSYGEIGTRGGTATGSFHEQTESAGRNHTHGLASRTGWIAFVNSSSGSSGHYYTKDDNQGWGCNASNCDPKVHIRVDGGDNNEGQHFHGLGGATASANTGHTHGVSGSVPTLPPYYGLLKIMRIK